MKLDNLARTRFGSWARDCLSLGHERKIGVKNAYKVFGGVGGEGGDLIDQDPHQNGGNCGSALAGFLLYSSK